MTENNGKWKSKELKLEAEKIFASQGKLISFIPASLNTSAPFLFFFRKQLSLLIWAAETKPKNINLRKNQFSLHTQSVMVSKWPSHLPKLLLCPSANHQPTASQYLNSEHPWGKKIMEQTVVQRIQLVWPYFPWGHSSLYIQGKMSFLCPVSCDLESSRII